MTLRWIEGWEAFTNQAPADRLYPGMTGSGIGPTDGASVLLDEAVSLTANTLIPSPVIVAAPANTWIVGFAMRPNSATTIEGSDHPYISLDNTDGEQIRIEFFDNNPPSSPGGANMYSVRIMRGATELASSNERWPLGAVAESYWIYFEFKITINNTTGTIDGKYTWVRKPNITPTAVSMTWDAAVSSLDTQNQTSTGADRFTLYGSSASRIVLDDMYFCDSAGSKNNDYLGKIIIKGQKPSGDGDTTDFSLSGGASSTQNAWDEVTTTTDDARRLSSSATNDVHLATVDAVEPEVSANSTVIGVRQDLVGRMETSGSLNIEHRWRKTTATAGETDGGDPLVVDSTTYVGHGEVLEDDPNTATDWVFADLSSYQHGCRNAG